MVSCIITTYNRSTNILKRAVNSILKQSYTDIELIVVNDYPENQELAKEINSMLATYAKNNDRYIRYIELEKNSGACIARNIGIEASRGEYIAFLDDDDEWLPEKIERMIEYLINNPAVGLVYSQYIIRSEKKDLQIKPPVYNADWFVHLLGQNYIGSTSFPLIRKKVLVEAGMFDAGMKSMQDWDTWLRIAKIANIAYCDIPLTIYHVEAESITTNIENKKKGHERMLKKYQEDYKRNKKEYSIRLDISAHDFFKYGAYHEGFEYLMKSVRMYPFQLEHFKVIKRVLQKKLRIE